MKKFEREERYIVIKITDLKYSSVENMLRKVLEEQHIPTRECVVVESDWPEYETVWKMLESRVNGEAIEIGQLNTDRDRLHTILSGMTRWLEEHQPDVFRRGIWEAME